MATPAEVKAAFAEFVKKAAPALNQDAAEAEASGNPYAKYLLPSAIINHQPNAPLYDEAKVNQIVDDALASLDDGDFMKIIGGVFDFALARLPGV